MTTRKEQIEEAASKYWTETTDFVEGLPPNEESFIAGAEWADANPHESIIELIHQRSIAFDDARDARTKLAIAVEALNCIRFQTQQESIGNKEFIHKLADDALENIKDAQ